MNFYYSPADSPLTKYNILNEDQLVYTCQYEELTFTKKLFDKNAELVATGSFILQID